MLFSDKNKTVPIQLCAQSPTLALQNWNLINVVEWPTEGKQIPSSCSLPCHCQII